MDTERAKRPDEVERVSGTIPAAWYLELKYENQQLLALVGSQQGDNERLHEAYHDALNVGAVCPFCEELA